MFLCSCFLTHHKGLIYTFVGPMGVILLVEMYDCVNVVVPTAILLLGQFDGIHKCSKDFHVQVIC